MQEKKKRSTYSLRWTHRQFIVICLLILLGFGIYVLINRPATLYINSDGDDLLFYTYGSSNPDDPNKDMLMMYNSRTNQKQALMPKPRDWKISSDGRIAFQDADKINITVSDVQSIENPQVIIEAQYDEVTIESWSPKGTYLLYSDRDVDHRFNRLYIWDGERSIDITPQDWKHPNDYSQELYLGSLRWSSEEKLAFELTSRFEEYVWYRIYVWDGEQTVDVTPAELLEPIDKSELDRYGNRIRSYFTSMQWSSSQHLAFGFNQNYVDSRWERLSFIWDGENTYQLGGRNHGWSADGHLMISRSNGQSVGQWDGKSYVDSQPKIEPIPDLQIDNTTYHASGWAHEKNIVYRSHEGGYTQNYYLWDGTYLSYIDTTTVGMGSSPWRFNERGERSRFTNDPTIGQHGAVATSYIHLRDRNNNPVIDINGHMPAWSHDGYIAFCAPLHRLSIYNGHEIILIQDSWTVEAQWKNGGRLHCTNG